MLRVRKNWIDRLQIGIQAGEQYFAFFVLDFVLAKVSDFKVSPDRGEDSLAEKDMSLAHLCGAPRRYFRCTINCLAVVIAVDEFHHLENCDVISSWVTQCAEEVRLSNKAVTFMKKECCSLRRPGTTREVVRSEMTTGNAQKLRDNIFEVSFRFWHATLKKEGYQKRT